MVSDTHLRNRQPFRFYEFFAGAGMARLGLEPAWKCVWANDNDPRKIRIYENNFGGEHLDQRDIAEVAREHKAHPKEVEARRRNAQARIPKFPRSIDMAWASFPCQDLSLAGWQRGMSAERSGTYWPFWSLMDALMATGDEPPIIVIENVQGLLYGENIRGLCESLAALEMQFGTMLIDARHFLPQSRPRVFVVAVDSQVPCGDLALEGPGGCRWFPKVVRSAYENLPRDLKDRWRWWHLPDPPGRSVTLEDIVEKNPKGVEYHSREETKRLINMMTPKNRRKIDNAMRSGELQVGFLYKRTRSGVQRAEVRFDGVAGCLRTPRGGSSRQTVVVVSGKRIRTRLLAPVEAARLMGAHGIKFPPDFSYNESYMAMGDGVAVPVVQHLAEHFLTPLATRSREKSPRAKQINNLQHVQHNHYRERVQERVAAWANGRPESTTSTIAKERNEQHRP